MFVEVLAGKGRSKLFKYTVENKAITSKAGELLCKLLDFEWVYFLHAYEMYLYTGDSKDLSHAESLYSKLDPEAQKVVGTIFPPTKQDLAILERIAEVLADITKRINSKDDTKKASYDYFLFILTNFYDYKPPIASMSDYAVSILNYIEPLIKEYCEIKFLAQDYEKLLFEIGNSTSIFVLDGLLGDLCDLLHKECNKREELSFANNIWPPYGIYRTHCKYVCEFIETYRMTYIDILRPYYCGYDLDNWFDEETMSSDERAVLAKLNEDTDIRAILSICKVAKLPYKSFFIDILFDHNYQKNRNEGMRTHLTNTFDLICHAILFCFHDNSFPIMRCKYCGKYFPREENSQKVCRDCMKLPGSQKLLKEKFGFDAYGTVNNIYRRLCYGPNGKYAADKYVQDGLNSKQSQTLVSTLCDISNRLRKDVDTAWERYKTYLDPMMKEEFVEFLHEWIIELDKYYTLDQVKSLILEALNKADTPSTCPIFEIKEIRLNIIHIEEHIVTVPLPSRL